VSSRTDAVQHCTTQAMPLKPIPRAALLRLRMVCHPWWLRDLLCQENEGLLSPKYLQQMTSSHGPTVPPRVAAQVPGTNAQLSCRSPQPMGSAGPPLLLAISEHAPGP